MNPCILVLGSGRSGTTLLAKLLDSHPDVLYRHEPDIVNVNKEIPFLPHGNIDIFTSKTRDYILSLIQTRHIRAVSQLPVFSKRYRNGPQQAAYRTSVYVAKAVNSLPNSIFKSPVSIPDMVPLRREHCVVYVIKSVNSLCRARLFYLSFPGIKIVHVIRNPCGVIASLLRGIDQGLMSKDIYIQPLFQSAYSDRFPFSLDDIMSRSTEEKLAYQWMCQNDIVYTDMIREENYVNVRYEDICTRGRDQLSTLFNACSLSMTTQTENFLRNLENTGPQRNSYFSTVRPIRSALNKWKHQLKKQQILNITNIVLHSQVGRLYSNELQEAAGR